MCQENFNCLKANPKFKGFNIWRKQFTFNLCCFTALLEKLKKKSIFHRIFMPVFSSSSIEAQPIAVPIYLMNSQPTRVSSTHIKGTVKTYAQLCSKRFFMFSLTMQETQDEMRLLTGYRQFSVKTIKQLCQHESHFYVPTSNHLFLHLCQHLQRVSASIQNRSIPFSVADNKENSQEHMLNHRPAKLLLFTLTLSCLRHLLTQNSE